MALTSKQKQAVALSALKRIRSGQPNPFKGSATSPSKPLQNSPPKK